ncbi:MAG: MBL fold metallo-hydrolase [Chloroflexi bacterium]|nr:MBL fold metallo-hydrolase [Chloroflexota bacterium]
MDQQAVGDIAVPRRSDAAVARVVALPLPHAGRASVNALLVLGEPLTLVDTGLLTDDSLAALRGGLALHGYQVANVEQIVITHAHLDHFGAAATLVRESGARVAGDTAGLPDMATFGSAWDEQQAYRLSLYAMAGAPAALIDHARHWGEHYRTLGEPIVADLGLADGDRIRMGDADWTVVSVPGHAASSIALHDPAGGLLLSGDVLVGNGAANVTLHRVGDGHLPAGWQLDILASLRRLAALAPSRIFPGHGPTIESPAATIAERLARVESRLAQVLAYLAAPRTAYDVSGYLYDAPVATTWVGLSAALGYVDALEARGAAVVETRHGVRFYQRAVG